MEKEQIRSSAEQYYQNGDFFCSEAIVKAVLEGFGHTVPHSAVAMASGFPAGIGACGCTCGALVGGVMSLGYFFGRSEAKGAEVSKAMALSKELHDRFKKRNKCTCCRTLTRSFAKGSSEHLNNCVRLTGEVTQDVVEIINREKNAEKH